MEKQMSIFSNLLYRFSSRGILWPAIYGSIFGICVLHFSTFVSAFIRALIGYLLMFPLIGIFTPITYTVMLTASAIVGHNSTGPFWGNAALIVLGIHLIRTIAMLILVKKYPAQTQALDSQYQKKQRDQ